MTKKGKRRSTVAADTDTMDVNVTTTDHIRNELLCFMQNKSATIAFDHLVKLCSDFYTLDEAVAARQLLDQYMPSGNRLNRRQGDNALWATVEDLLKTVVNPYLNLPIFYAVSMDRLPPVDVNSCDMSAILVELRALRSEVRSTSELKSEVSALKSELMQLRTEVNDLKTAGGSHSDEWPPLTLPENVHQPDLSSSMQVRFSRLASDLHRRPIDETRISRPTTSQARPKLTTVLGVAKENQNVRSVETSRVIDLFISRLNPHTMSTELIDCVQQTLPGIAKENIKCSKLKAKYEHLYSSYHIAITVLSTIMREAISSLMKPESWPAGLLVRRYFAPKQPNHNDGTD